MGAITTELLPVAGKMDVIELDRDLIPRLQVLCDGLGELNIHQADALRYDFSTLASNGKLRIVGNLPYNISTPLLFHLLSYLEHIQDMIFMLQNEVVQRMVAIPNTTKYGRLTVMLQYFFKINALFPVPPEAFDPQPKVMSAIVRLVPHTTIEHPVDDFEWFETIVRDAFGLRRKTLSNSLGKHLNTEDFVALNIAPSVRAENLSIKDFVAIANYKHAQR